MSLDNMKVYKQEEKDGLADIILKNNSIAYTSYPKSFKDINTKEGLEQVIASNKFGANPSQKDLFYLESILASVGINKNKDIFLKEELWNARSSPEDKPFNYMHNEDDIIGHLTSSYAVTKEGFVIPNDLELEKVPDQFNIVTGAVLYKYWKDESKAERMQNIIASISSEEEIKEEEWFVSMECLFPKFDYGLISASGELTIVERNSETSFLTKHLSAYGGSGTYENYSIGRVLRNFFFSGKGLVDNPANPESLILSSSIAKNISYTNTLKKKTENKMSEDTVSMKQFQDLQSKYEASIAFTQASAEKEVANLTEKFAKAVEENKVLTQKLIDAESKVEAAAAEKVELNKSLDDSKAELEKSKASVNEMKTEIAKASRVNKLTDIGVKSEDAVKMVEDFVSASDEMFDRVVAMQKSLLETEDAKYNFETTDEEKKKKKEKEAKDMKAKAEQEAAAAAKEATEGLEDAEAGENANLGTADNSSDELQKSVASFYQDYSKTLKKSTK